MNSQRSADDHGSHAFPRQSPLLQSLFPSTVASAELRPTAIANTGTRNGQSDIRVGSKRARDFAAGRLCVRYAATNLGIAEFPLEVLPDRSPNWPQTVTGSITHTDGFCGAVLAERRGFRALGLDAEVIGHVTPEVWSLICLPEELAWLRGLPSGERIAAATLIFSAKECFYKCQYTLTQEWLEFDAVTVQCQGYEEGIGWFFIRPRQRLRLTEFASGPFIGRFRFEQDLVIVGMAIANTVSDPLDGVGVRMDGGVVKSGAAAESAPTK